jgi:RNA polymerase sigma-B factor
MPETSTAVMTPAPAAADIEGRRARAMAMLQRMAQLSPEDGEWSRLREAVIEDHMDYARHLARRYARSRFGGPEDLDQVAYLGLVKAVDKFEPEQGTVFLAYATPMILGEIRRHFRDTSWAVHVPRRLQELTGALHKALDVLRAELGREPSLPELAARLEVGEDEVVEAFDASDAYNTTSLDRTVGPDEDSASLGELLGSEDPGFEHVIDHEVLRGLMGQLSEQDKKILLLRYFRGMTQAQIGEEIGASQMHVSRLLARILSRLRAGFLTEA